MSCNIPFERCAPDGTRVLGVLDPEAGSSTYFNLDGTAYAGDPTLLADCELGEASVADNGDNTATISAVQVDGSATNATVLTDLLVNDGDVGVSRSIDPAADVLIHDGNVEASSAWDALWPGCDITVDAGDVYKTPDGKLKTAPPRCGLVRVIDTIKSTPNYRPFELGQTSDTSVELMESSFDIVNPSCYDWNVNLDVQLHGGFFNQLRHAIALRAELEFDGGGYEEVAHHAFHQPTAAGETTHDVWNQILRITGGIPAGGTVTVGYRMLGYFRQYSGTVATSNGTQVTNPDIYIAVVAGPDC